MEQTFPNFRIRDFYLEFEEELSFLAYSAKDRLKTEGERDRERDRQTDRKKDLQCYSVHGSFQSTPSGTEQNRSHTERHLFCYIRNFALQGNKETEKRIIWIEQLRPHFTIPNGGVSL